jgi:phage shock protein PspC (stress-responsive transcriptional regulator)
MTAATADQQNQQPAAEQRNVALPLRSDTFLGVCEAIGQDLNINPNWIRILFAPIILFSPLSALAGYLGLGAVVATSRYFFPASASRTVEQHAREHEAADDNDKAEERLAA